MDKLRTPAGLGAAIVAVVGIVCVTALTLTGHGDTQDTVFVCGIVSVLVTSLLNLATTQQVQRTAEQVQRDTAPLGRVNGQLEQAMQAAINIPTDLQEQLNQLHEATGSSHQATP